MANVIQFDDMQSRSYLGSYLDVLHGLQKIDRECDEMEPLEQSKCSQRQMLIAFSRDLQSKNCDGTKPKFPQTAHITEDSGDAIIQLQKLCQAAMAVDSVAVDSVAVNPGEEEKGKKMEEPMEEIKKKMEPLMKKVKEHGAKGVKKLIEEDFYVRKIIDFFNISISDPSDHAISMLGEGVEFMNTVVQGQISGKQAALFALKAAQLALKIGGCFIPFPGNLLAAKVVDAGIQYLSEESAESLEDTIDRIATEAVDRALKVQALREAKIFVDASEQQIRFHDSLDNGWAHLEGVSVGEYSAAKDLKTLFSAETAFNRWLIIENAVAAALHRLLPPERPDARSKKDQGDLQKVERAKFFVIVDHFLLYLLVLSKMADKVEMESPEHKLHDSVQERAREMAKIVLPSLAVMWEKQWDNPWVKMFYQKDPDYEAEVFHNKYRWEKGFAAEYWWENHPNRQKRAVKKFHDFQSKKRREYEPLYKTNMEALETKLTGILGNKLLYPQELHLSERCRDLLWTGPMHVPVQIAALGLHRCDGTRTAEFILKCLWYPLYDAGISCPAQELAIEKEQDPGDYFDLRWSFSNPASCSSGCLHDSRYLRATLEGAMPKEEPSSWRDVKAKDIQVLECAPDEVISHLHYLPKSRTGATLLSFGLVRDRNLVSFGCVKIPGLHKINNTGYTFDASEMGTEPYKQPLSAGPPCARDGEG